MARFHIISRCPLPVQFWLFGLDARHGDLQRRGFARQVTTYGSSAYTLDALTLHSAGLRLDLDAGLLQFTRQTRTFTLGGQFLPAAQGLTLCRPALAAHEAWVADTYSLSHRTQQLGEHRLPPPVHRNVATWQAYFGQLEGVSSAATIQAAFSTSGSWHTRVKPLPATDPHLTFLPLFTRVPVTLRAAHTGY
ncbi:hypothetical protein ASF71_20110 [Deinococcus sp. Leaf326]|nr:hypothetical protein ASF71_20110 [Deinococcus sp. Leaf326]